MRLYRSKKRKGVFNQDRVQLWLKHTGEDIAETVVVISGGTGRRIAYAIQKVEICCKVVKY
jgi:hypothetical protein